MSKLRLEKAIDKVIREASTQAVRICPDVVSESYYTKQIIEAISKHMAGCPMLTRSQVEEIIRHDPGTNIPFYYRVIAAQHKLCEEHLLKEVTNATKS